ncbi:hypothetical protein K227x_56110 [Rubripirellula lacrimiformis]|uniref:Uncharacterized protein n=1 Tax=Rubripirellula lacrimiformis TaxID=1930273 RepID=A0A517NJ78_9BACT|nr:hypothetical protein K227x_56110 [Rubripirellula lacrimiformis]
MNGNTAMGVNQVIEDLGFPPTDVEQRCRQSPKRPTYSDTK